MSPVPSHDALQYLPSSDGGHEHGGFLQVLSSAMNFSLKPDYVLVETVAELNTSTEANRKMRVGFRSDIKHGISTTVREGSE